MNHEKIYGKNLKLAGLFILAVLALIILSFLWKLTLLITESRYDSKHQFILEVKTNANPILVCFSPDSQSLSILDLNGVTRDTHLQENLDIPIDAYITGQTYNSVADNLWQSIFSFQSSSDINIVDKLKLWWYSSSVHSDSLSEDTVTLPISEDVATNILQKVFLDKSIYQEAKTIAIVNASGISGKGARLARLMTNIGTDVIMVSTAQSLVDHSKIEYTTSYTYTNRRIDQILHMQESSSNQKPIFADIIITIGTDLTNSNLF